MLGVALADTWSALTLQRHEKQLRKPVDQLSKGTEDSPDLNTQSESSTEQLHPCESTLHLTTTETKTRCGRIVRRHECGVGQQTQVKTKVALQLEPQELELHFTDCTNTLSQIPSGPPLASHPAILPLPLHRIDIATVCRSAFASPSLLARNSLSSCVLRVHPSQQNKTQSSRKPRNLCFQHHRILQHHLESKFGADPLIPK